MSQVGASEIAVGDQIGERFYPPGLLSSFSEGVIRWMDGSAPERRLVVLFRYLS
jgi:hypothetical protein